MSHSSSGLAHNAPDVAVDLALIQQSRLYNADLAPVPVSAANVLSGLSTFT